jgi:predicted PurR-regulated permease PerM
MIIPPRATLNLALILSTLFVIFWLFSNIIVYILVSLVISSILRPITDYVDNLEFFRVKVPRWLAVFVSFLVLATIPVLFTLMFVPLILDQISVLQEVSFDKIIVRLQEPADQVDYFIINNISSKHESGYLVKEINDTVLSFIESIQIGELLNYAFQFTGTIFIYLLAISFITFFLLYEKGILRRSLLATVPNAYFEVAITTVYKIEQLLSNYLVALLLQNMIMFTIIALGLTLSGVKYALTIAIFAAIINVIPYLGPVMGLIFALLVVFSARIIDTDFHHLLLLSVRLIPVFAMAQLIDNILLQPIIFSKSVKAHPLEIFIVIFAGAAVMGVLGMIAAIPVYTILRVSYMELSKGYRQYHIFQINKPIPPFSTKQPPNQKQVGGK